MDQNLRDLIALQQLQATQKLVQQAAPSIGSKCPYCGGVPEPNYERCKHCASHLSWVEGHPCKPGGEKQLAKWIKDKEQAAIQQEREQQNKTKGLTDVLVIIGALLVFCFIIKSTIK